MLPGGGYWVVQAHLAVGPYPAGYSQRSAGDVVGGLLAAGIRTFVNLMEEDPHGLHPYERLAREQAASAPTEVDLLRFPIEDCSIPTPEHMDRIVSAIDASIADGRPVYAHCWGGRGRAGLVAGVYLIRTGRASADDFVRVIGNLRGRDPSVQPSPETAEQIAFVRRYTDGRF